MKIAWLLLALVGCGSPVETVDGMRAGPSLRRFRIADPSPFTLPPTAVLHAAGESCDLQGLRACADRFDTLLCDGEHWHDSGICAAPEYCDPNPGIWSGECVEWDGGP